jgi:hypothetical protein
MATINFEEKTTAHVDDMEHHSEVTFQFPNHFAEINSIIITGARIDGGATLTVSSDWTCNYAGD